MTGVGASLTEVLVLQGGTVMTGLMAEKKVKIDDDDADL